MSALAPTLDLAQVNAELGRDAQALVNWAVGLDLPTIVTTNFRPFEAVILHMVTRARPDVSTSCERCTASSTVVEAT